MSSKNRGKTSSRKTQEEQQGGHSGKQPKMGKRARANVARQKAIADSRHRKALRTARKDGDAATVRALTRRD